MVLDESVSECTDWPSHSLPVATVAVEVYAALVADDMLPTVVALTAPFVALKEDNRFCAELFLRIPGRDDSVIGGLLGG